MKRPISFLCIGISALAVGVLPASSHRTVGVTPAKQAALSDAVLDDQTVAGWFDTSLKQGDGQPCVVRTGNEVTELVDGVAALKTMSDTMRAVRGNLTVLKTLGGAPGEPIYPREFGSITEGSDHNLYFTTSQGGANNKGAICRIEPDAKNFTVLHSFNGSDGPDPRGGMSMGNDGTFYGTTVGGGTLPDGKPGYGTIWRLSADGSQFASVWTFRNGAFYPPIPAGRQPTEQEKRDAAGSYPVSPPVQGKDGSWYGITSYANNQQWGVIYTLGGGYKGLYVFNPKDVAELGSFGCSMTAGWDGNLYGTTIKGGLGWGTVFKMGSGGGGLTTVHKFDFKNGAGAYSLIQGEDKNLYGTASGGGAGNGGLVYKLSPGGDYSIIHTFMASDGSTPTAGLVQARDKSLYGVAEFQGPTGRGLVFKLGENGENFRIIHAFNGSMAEGHYCVSCPIIHSNHKLYGLSDESVGAAGGGGVVYSLEVEHPDFIYALNWWMLDTFPLFAPNAPSLTTDFMEANNKGVQMRAMLWRNSTADEVSLQNNVLVKVPQNNNEVVHLNGFSNGAAILDNKTLLFGSHHQKILAVHGPDGLTAFFGGVDFNQDRVYPNTSKGSPLHDVHCKVRGPAAVDLLNVFVQRWNDHPDHKALDNLKDPLSGDPKKVPDPANGGFCSVQVGRTFGNGLAHKWADLSPRANNTPYSFAPNGEQSAARIILHGINHARSFIYVEDQYFVDTVDPDNPNSLNVRAALMARLTDPNFKHLIVLIPHGSITDMGPPKVHNQVNYRRSRLITALKSAAPGKVHVFFRGPVGGGHSYIHAKTWIFDDQFAVIGSANTNRRSWTHDSEVAVGICDKGDGTKLRMPHRLRMRLWAEHLNIGVVGGVPYKYEAQMYDPMKGIDMWINHRPPTAYVVPYDEAQDIESFCTSPVTRALANTEWDEGIDPDGR